jgi:hypothetical protein
MKRLFKLLCCILNSNLIYFCRLDTKERHHTPIDQVGHFRLHLHINVFDQHACHDGKSREGIVVLVKFFID